MLRTTPLKRWAPLQRRTPMKPKPRPKKTSAEQEHLDFVAGLGCYCCWIESRRWVKPKVHHSRTAPDGTNYGTGQRASHFETFPLCSRHHRNDGRIGEALHAGPREWEARFGSELKAIAWVYRCKAEGFILPDLEGTPLPQEIPALSMNDYEEAP